MKNAKINRNRKSGFTLAELLVVVAIIMILAGVSFVAVIRYQRSLRRLEMDQTAKEIFLAAQNRLSLEKSHGTMERLLNGSFGSDKEKNKLGTKVETGNRGAGTGDDDENSSSDITADVPALYCIRYTAKDSTSNENEDIRERLLPFGSIDDTVRIGGNYLIFYEPKNGSVRAVWYSDTYEFADTDYTENALNEAAKSTSKRESFTGTNAKFENHGCPVGYYGGARTEDDNRTDDTKLDPISLELKNEEVLYAVITDPNIAYPARQYKYNLNLWIEGVDSGAKAYVDLTSSTVSSAVRYSKDSANKQHYWILDDITAENTRFADLNSNPNLEWNDAKRMIPGEDVRVYAEIYAKGQTKPYQTTTVYQESSLFQDKKANGVTIANARHLENLDYRVSQFDPSKERLNIQTMDENNTGDKRYVAEQLKDVSWTEFRKKVAAIHASGNNGFGRLEKTEAKITTYYWRNTDSSANEVGTTTGCFLPVEPQFALNYKGNAFYVENLIIHPNQDTECAGLFGSVKKNLTVEKLKLFYPVVTSKAGTGGLIGLGETGTQITVKDVIVQYPSIWAEGATTVTSPPSIDAGGIIGDFRGTQLTLDGCLVENQALVQVSGNAKANDTKTLPEGVEADALEVHAKSSCAGGLLGSMTDGNLNVYSCSASVYVNAYSYAGGLLGSVTTSGTVNIDSSYVGGHTAEGKMLSAPVPGDTNFANTTGRYNIVSRNNAAGGLAAIVPTNTDISYSYVTASVYANPAQSSTTDSGTPEWGSESNADDSQQYAAFVRYAGNTGTAATGKKASDYNYCYSIALVNGARAQVYSADLNDAFQKILNGETNSGISGIAAILGISTGKAFPYDNTLGTTYPMPTVLDLIKSDTTVTDETKKTLSRYATVHIGDWMVPVKNKDCNFQVINGNRLTVRINTGTADQNDKIDYAIKVHGEKSNQDVYFRIQADGSNGVTIDRSYPASSWTTQYTQYTSPALTNLYNNGKVGQFDFYLDNISKPGCRFGSLVPSAFSPGEDITINVASLNNDGEWNSISSKTFEETNAVLTNSCFGSIEKNPTNTDLVGEHNNKKIEKIKAAFSSAQAATGKDLGLITTEDGNYYVQIDNSRHLQNLSSYISGGYENDFYTKLAGAIQTDNIYWSGNSTSSYTKSFQEELGEKVKVYGASYPTENDWNEGMFYPIYLNDNRNSLAFSYFGSDCKISGLDIKGDSAAGLFGEVKSPFSATNLTFENVSADGKDTGALVGSFSGNQITIQNVKLSTTGGNAQNTITGNGCTGGIVGSASGEVKINNSGIDGETEVTSKGSDWSAVAGGVIGSTSNNVNFDKVTLTAEVTVNVTANNSNAKAGGFIGNVGNGSSNVKIVDSAINGSTRITASYGYAAGTMAYIGYQVNAEVENLRMEGNLTVTGQNATGGLVGFTQGSMLTISNSELKTTSVNSTEGRAAGLVADTTSEVKITGTQIDGRLTVEGKQETGGFVGNTTNKLSIENSSVLDAAVTSSNNKAGGLVGVTATGNDVAVEKVKVIGKNTEIRGHNTTGGLFGRLETVKVTISNAAVSAFVYASQTDSGDANSNAGGLIGEMKITGSDASSITNSYYGGRTVNGKYASIQLPYGGSGGNSYTANIVANQAAGGIVGWIENASTNLSISNCFNTGSVHGISSEAGKSVGGFFGSIHQGTITMSNCYSMGKLTGGDVKAGLIGSTGRGGQNYTWYTTNIICSNVYYLNAFNDENQNTFYGNPKGETQTIKDANGGTIANNSTAVIISLTDKIEGAAETNDLSAITMVYDETLTGRSYKCKNWTRETEGNTERIAYYGDWPEVHYDGSFVYFSGTRSTDKKTGEYTFSCYDGVSFKSKLTALEGFDLESSGFGIITKLTDRDKVSELYSYAENQTGPYANVKPEGKATSTEYSIVHYFGADYYLFRLTDPKPNSKFSSIYIKKNSDDSVYLVKKTSNTIMFTKQ